MKKALQLLLFLLLTCPLFSQDRIITVKGDTINCTITKIAGGYIYYSIKTGEEIQNKVLDKKLIRNYYLDQPNKTGLTSKIDTLINTFPHFNITLSGGFSRRIARIDTKLPAVLRTYYEEMLKGYNIHASFLYFPTTVFGFGLKYNMFTSSTQSAAPVTLTFANGVILTARLSNDIYLNFFGPAISLRRVSEDKKIITYSNFSIGYMDYNDYMIFIIPFEITGNTIGFNSDLGADFYIGKQWYAGLMLSLSSGVIRKIEVSNSLDPPQTINLKEEEYIGLLRGDISFGLKYTF